MATKATDSEIIYSLQYKCPDGRIENKGLYTEDRLKKDFPEMKLFDDETYRDADRNGYGLIGFPATVLR